MADLRAPTPSAAAELVFPARHEWLEKLSGLRRRLTATLAARLSGRRTALNAALSRLRHPSRRITDGRLRLDDLVFRLDTRTKALISRQRERLSWREGRFIAIINGDLCGKYKVKVKNYNRYLLKNMEIIIIKNRKALHHLTERLNDLSPTAILKRGYSITRSLPERQTLRRSDETTAGEAVEIQLAHGILKATITETGANPAGEQENI